MTALRACGLGDIPMTPLQVRAWHRLLIDTGRCPAPRRG